MVGDINKSILIGRLAKDPDLRQTKTGTSVADFTIAVNHVYKSGDEKREEVSFIKCSVWGKAAESLVKYTAKGHRIGIEGRLKQHSWDDKDGHKRSSLEVVVETFQFLQAKSGDAKPCETEEAIQKRYDEMTVKVYSDEDPLPF